MKRIALLTVLAGLWTLASASRVEAQNQGQRPPDFVSPEVSGERKIKFRLFAPKAEAVRLSAGDIPGNGPGTEMKKSDQGVWEVEVGPVPAGAYRYRFSVDGLAVMDPRNPATSESLGNSGVWSSCPGRT